MRLFIVLCVVLSFRAVNSLAEELRISNRPPLPNEIGYRPAEGEIARLNPPSFIWLHEKAADTYSIQWDTDSDFSEAQMVSGFTLNTYTHNAPLKPGTYFWRYRYVTADGQESEWSAVRRVTVPDRAIEFPLPTRGERLERVPKAHPRLFMRPEDLPRLREQAAGKLAGMFAKLQGEADRIIEAGPTPEPTHLGSARDKENAEAIKYWWPNREQTERACKEAETLAFVYLITQDKKYGEAARHWVLHLAAWNPDGPTNFALNCEAAKPLLFRFARAYDWAHDMFTPQERRQVAAMMQRRIQDAWKSGEVAHGTGHLNSPYGSHANRVFHKIGESGIAFLGEIPEAEMWLDYALNKFFACYPVWSDDDGGWHEGVSYWSGYMSKAVWWLEVMRSALGIDGLKKPFFAHVGDYPIYIAPPHSPNSGFGDLAYRPPSSGVGSFLEYHLRMKGSQPDGERAAYWRWWADAWEMNAAEGILGFLYAANLPPLPAAKPPTDLPQSKLFRGIGVASLHTTLVDSRDDVHFLFKSSPFGTQSHGHNPHNTFQLNAYGDCLLTTCGYRDLHGSKFHYNWVHSTTAHNGVLVNGEGQIKHTSAPHGRITKAEFTPHWDYCVGDATDAYGGRLTRYDRHVVFVKSAVADSKFGPFIVICDDLQAKEPSSYQFMLHALAPFTMNQAKSRLLVEQPRAGLEVQYVSPAALAFRQWDGFTPPPTKEFPNQWHVEASTTDKQRQLVMFTVLVPYRSGHRPEWSVERVAAGNAMDIRISYGGERTIVSIPRANTDASVRVERE